MANAGTKPSHSDTEYRSKNIKYTKYLYIDKNSRDENDGEDPGHLHQLFETAVQQNLAPVRLREPIGNRSCPPTAAR